MTATHITLPQGPALLARAGVSLNDALWFYRQPRGCSVSDAARLDVNRRKVSCFLATTKGPARARRARA